MTQNCITFENSYAGLPGDFYAEIDPVPVERPSLIRFNHKLADELGLDCASLSEEELAQIFSGNEVPSSARPVAMVYAGHQFGNFVPRLGDGRAVLLGEIVDPEGVRRDIHLKGSGRTPYSRNGDGRSPLGPVIREYIVSEAMHALGIPTTRSLAAVATGEAVRRETELPGAVLTRVGLSHVRVGTFQYFAARRDIESVRILADYVIDRLYPEHAGKDRYEAFLQAVIARQARLISQWMSVGFIHGVMNTDNMTVSGETIDYGPCAFMDHYDPETVFSSIDIYGRYAYANQSRIAMWNLARFAECLLPLLDNDIERAVKRAGDAVDNFRHIFDEEMIRRMRAKVGLERAEEGDEALINAFLTHMQEGRSDFTLAFRRLCNAAEEPDAALRSVIGKSYDVAEWIARWKARLDREGRPLSSIAAGMRRVNPAYIPRNHLVESAIKNAQAGDYSRMEELIAVLSDPYEERRGFSLYETPPADAERVLQTFCGT